MTFKTHCEIAKGRIDPAPMVDIVFLLLIFLVLTGPFVMTPGFGVVELQTVNKPPSSTYQNLVVTVTQSNMVFFNNQQIKLEDLPPLLKTPPNSTRSPDNTPVLVIKADKMVPHGTIVQIMGMAFDAGITAVNLAARPALPGPLSPR